MKALVFSKIGEVKIADVADPRIENEKDAVVKITATSICGTDLHMVRGTMAGMRPGTVLGHEAVGIVESVGDEVKNFKIGDRVVVCSTIACGECEFCQAEDYSCCDNANPKGPEAGTAFFGGPELTGPFNGLQAERARIPYADFVLVAVPATVSDEDALLTSDIFPTGYMAAEMGDIKPGDTVAVFGCGPVGQMAIASAKLMGASKVFAIDTIADRLAQASQQGALTINYSQIDPVKTLKSLTNGFGPDCCIDAVGVDAQAAHSGPAKPGMLENIANTIDQKMMAPHSVGSGDQWRQGDAPSQVLMWCVEAVRKSGVVSIVGVYPPQAKFFPIGLAMSKALTMRAANCSHFKYVPKLLKMVEEGKFRPSEILSKVERFGDAVECYKHFDKREPGWIKVELLPGQKAAAAK